jgi:hypothetical protein
LVTVLFFSSLIKWQNYIIKPLAIW